MKNQKMTYRFNRKAARGKVEVYRNILGVEIKVDGKPFAMIDLYYDERRKNLRLVLLNDVGDPIFVSEIDRAQNAAKIVIDDLVAHAALSHGSAKEISLNLPED